MAVTIAQLTDVHLGFSEVRPEPNETRLQATLAAVAAHRPDALFVTGDLTENGAAADYARLRAALTGVACPVHLLVGNHDRRAAFMAAFPEAPVDDGFVQYVADVGELRCIVLDTLAEGRHGGAFCGQRAAWLAARLNEATDRPTLILLHHPPAATGVAWMDPDPAAPWIARLGVAVARRPNVLALAAGHVHLPSVTGWQGTQVTVAPSVGPGVALSFAEIDPDAPDGRAMITDSMPGFALHRWDGARLTTHFATLPPAALARYDEQFQPLVRLTMAEQDEDRDGGKAIGP